MSGLGKSQDKTPAPFPVSENESLQGAPRAPPGKLLEGALLQLILAEAFFGPQEGFR